MVYQMIIKAIYIGNEDEAFIYRDFSDKFNIIYSDDNNKGKTIVIQAIAYCLGNIPVFPTSFEYGKYYYILDITCGDKMFRICRKQKNIIVNKSGVLSFFDNISEFKRYWNNEFFKLPIIQKMNITKIVDPELYIQMFFVGQDKKLTYDIVNKGYYKKEDFYNMIYAIKGLVSAGRSEAQIKEIKEQISELKNERQNLLKVNKILKQCGNVEEIIGKTNDRRALEEILNKADEIKDIIIDLKKERNRAIARKKKNEAVLKELRSLNRDMRSGEVVCMDCGSHHISYESADSEFSFDISTSEMRTQILNAIEEKVSIYGEEIGRLTDEINFQQERFDKCLSVEEEVSLELLLVVKREMDNSRDADKRITEIEKNLIELEDDFNIKNAVEEDIQEKQKELVKDIVQKMNEFYRYVDKEQGSKYNDIFTKRDKVYSGSEGTEFHLAKIYALQQILEHECPIIIDSFRAEDLSTERENNVLDMFREISNQIIFTTTLKKEEKGKYEREDVNCIDFSSHTTNHILSSIYLEEFIGELRNFSIRI